jgi:hypothetical protein
MEQVTQPSKESFVEWKESEVTQYVMQKLKESQDMWKNYLCEGHTVGAEGAFSTEAVVARIQTYNDLLEIDYAD